MNAKSDRLKKLENEMRDLEEWLKLGLVPKKDVEKHKLEIKDLNKKIDEEKRRLQQAKETGDYEEVVARKPNTRPAPFADSTTMPDIDLGEDFVDYQGNDVDSYEFDTSSIIEEKDTAEETILETKEEDNPFSDKNRWARGIIDPDDDNW